MKTFEELLKDDTHRERLIKTLGLPARNKASYDKVVNDLKAYDSVLNHYNKMKDAVEKDLVLLKESMGDEYDFVYQDVIDKVVEDLHSDKDWKIFIEGDYTVEIPDEIITAARHFYQPEFADRYYLSFDLVQANWQAVKEVIGINLDMNYDEFIEQYVGDYLIPQHSRAIRGKVFTPQGQIMKYNLKKVYESIPYIIKHTDLGLNVKDVVSVYADEVLFEINEDTFRKLDKKLQDEISTELQKKLGIKYHVEPFKLVDNKAFDSYTRINRDLTYEYKMLGTDLENLVFRVANNIDFDETTVSRPLLRKYKELDFHKEASKMINRINEELEEINEVINK